MNLSRFTLKKISGKNAVVPDEKVFDLPEKVLQFGTGRLLRGLPDYYIDKANRQGIFNGRVVMVKSTSRGDDTAFERQDELYTLCERGVVNGKKIEKNIICSPISRTLKAQEEWSDILECAHNRELKIIISNTTEVGIKLVNDDIRKHPPVSFPGKLLAFLYERFRAFGGAEDSGFVIVPTELILQNGKKLESVVLELAHLNSLEDEFIEWLEKRNYFCNSLVDRIVTGMPDENSRQEIESALGYKDELLTVSEVYSLWAIEGDNKIKAVLSFAQADETVIIEPDIEMHRELKLRLLNGTHTLSCGVAFLAGISTVLEAMQNKTMSAFIEELMKHEIAPAIPVKIDKAVTDKFISTVLDRFSNPHIQHYWKNITLNYSSKMKSRCIPLLLKYFERCEKVPDLFAIGFAAYLRFMKPAKQDGKSYYGEFSGETYLIDDESANILATAWKDSSPKDVVNKVLKDEALWGLDISSLEGFAQTVTGYLTEIVEHGMKATLESSLITSEKK